MMANNDMSRWCVLYTAPKSERKLVQRLHAAGYMAFCPMQIVFKKWKGQTKEVFAPLFPDCVFVEEATGVELFIASQGGVSFLYWTLRVRNCLFAPIKQSCRQGLCVC